MMTASRTSSTTTSTSCPRCQRTVDVELSAKHPVCRRCADAITRQARASQEQDSLCRWLSSRVDARGDPVEDSALTVYPHELRAVHRAVEQARLLSLDWRYPPAPMTYDRRVSALFAPWRQPHAAA